MLKPLIIFDLDGTLNQTELHALPAHAKAMEKMGVPVLPPEVILSTFGAPSSEYTKILVPDLEGEAVRTYLDYTLVYDEQFLPEKGKPYPGVPQLLTTLQERGMITAICSNSSLRYISSVLHALHIFSLIDVIQPRIKPHGKSYSLEYLLQSQPHSQAVLVGDTKYDMEAAADNGIPFIGCLYGYGKQQIENAEYLVESPAAILPLIESILEKKSG